MSNILSVEEIVERVCAALNGNGSITGASFSNGILTMTRSEGAPLTVSIPTGATASNVQLVDTITGLAVGAAVPLPSGGVGQLPAIFMESYTREEFPACGFVQNGPGKTQLGTLRFRAGVGTRISDNGSVDGVVSDITIHSTPKILPALFVQGAAIDLFDSGANSTTVPDIMTTTPELTWTNDNCESAFAHIVMNWQSAGMTLVNGSAAAFNVFGVYPRFRFEYSMDSGATWINAGTYVEFKDALVPMQPSESWSTIGAPGALPIEQFVAAGATIKIIIRTVFTITGALAQTPRFVYYAGAPSITLKPVRFT